MKELIVLKTTLRECGAVCRKFLGKVTYSLKGRANLLTKADIASQKKASDIIGSAFPGHTIIAEEMKSFNYKKESLWIIDPLDGTTNYAHNFPVFSISIAFLKKGVPLLGGIYDPSRNEMFIGIRGKGSFLNSKKIRVSGTNRLSKSLLVTGFAYDRAEKADFYCGFYSDFLKVSHDIRRTGAASIDMAWLACGRTDGYWEFNLKPWDVAAGKLIVEEGGGKVTDFSGRNWSNLSDWGRETLVTNGKVHAEMLKIIKRKLVATETQ